MSQMCSSIDTLSMAYLDEELAGEDRRELELHLLECASCRDYVQAERQEAATRRQLLAAPPAPDLVRAKVMKLLDREDQQTARTALRDRLSRWLLPGSSMAVAAAAMLVFVFLREPSTGTSLPVAKVQQAPMSVTGVHTGSWVQEQLDAPAPSFGAGIELVGAGATMVDGNRELLHLVYEVDFSSRQRLQLEAFLFRARDGELRDGQAVRSSEGHTVRVTRLDGMPAITYLDERGIGYIFVSHDLTERALLEQVLSSDLIERARHGR